MSASRTPLALAACLALVATALTASAQFRTGAELQPNDLIETLSVTIHIGEGDPVDEPLALDLGLGFPLWLHPAGRMMLVGERHVVQLVNGPNPKPISYAIDGQQATLPPGEVATHMAPVPLTLEFDAGDGSTATRTLVGGTYQFVVDPETSNWDAVPINAPNRGPVPFGAIPQESSADSLLPPDSSATFTFIVGGEPGNDIFQTTSQLLDGVQVSDIARVGIISQGFTNWMLRGYEIQINGMEFAKQEGVDARIGEVLTEANAELEELRRQTVALQADGQALAALAEAQLATPENLDQLAQLERDLDPLEQQIRAIEGRLNGSHPWYVDGNFAPRGRPAASVGSARVTLVTSQRDTSDSQNHIYFRTGGRRYLLERNADALGAGPGAQTFELDLQAAPLSAGDIRGFALGMLAAPHPFGDAPDRWNPQRLQVEIDGQIVYSSEESPFDRRSLKAVRLIPPSHLSSSGEIIVNDVHSEREVFLWIAGQGMGLDPDTGEVAELPDADDPGFPAPEDGPGDDEGFAALGDQPPGDDGFTPDNSDPEDPGFPGEPPVDPGFGGGGGGFVFGGPDNFFPPGPDPDLLATLDFLAFMTDLWLGTGPAPPLPPPVGQPPQIGSVQYGAASTSSALSTDTYQITWNVTGDESQVQNYLVELFTFKPERAFPVDTPIASQTVPTGTRQVTLTGQNQPNVDFFIPRVTAVPVDPAVTNQHSAFGPARTVFDPTKVIQNPVFDQFDQFMQGPDDGTGVHTPQNVPAPTFPAAPPAAGSTGMWRFDAPVPIQTSLGWLMVETQPATTFTDTLGQDHNRCFAFRAPNLGASKDMATTMVQFAPGTPPDVNGLPPAKLKFTAYAGFLGGPDANNSATFHLSCVAHVDDAGGTPLGTPLQSAAPTVGPFPPPPFTTPGFEFPDKKTFNATATPGGGTPMTKMEIEIDTATLTGDPAAAAAGNVLIDLTVAIQIVGGEADPTHPPAVLFWKIEQ